MPESVFRGKGTPSKVGWLHMSSACSVWLSKLYSYSCSDGKIQGEGSIAGLQSRVHRALLGQLGCAPSISADFRSYFKKPPSGDQVFSASALGVRGPQKHTHTSISTPAFLEESQGCTTALARYFLLCSVLSCFMRPVARWAGLGGVGYGELRG